MNETAGTIPQESTTDGSRAQSVASAYPASSFELQAIRLLAITEGASLLLLLFVAVPAKRIFDQPILVQWIGPIHGVLFLLYVASLVLWRSNLNWSWGRVLVAGLMASVPFAPFFPRFHAPVPVTGSRD